jgi:pyruvate,water dikinase
MQKFIVFRDTERNFIDRSTFTIKRAFLEANRRLMERKLVETDRDFWFLTVDELWTLLGGRANRTLTRAKIAARMKNFDRFDRKEYAPPMYLQKGLPVDLDAPKDVVDEPGILRGSGTSSGKVTGTARVIKSLGGLSRLRRGEILVCNATDPGWTSAFSLIKGIVTETGGPLAHAACLAREYGLPSVQIVNAVQLIPDGATITIDGSGGRVTIVDPAGVEPANDQSGAATARDAAVS